MKRALGFGLFAACLFAWPANAASPTPQDQQIALAGQRAVKVVVDHQGWYQVSFTRLKKAGLVLPKSKALLQLYVEGKQVPVRLTNTGIEFYGVPLDTLSTTRETYWLTTGKQAGLRFGAPRPSGSPGPASRTATATATVDPKDGGYYAGVLNGEASNFFGNAVRPGVVITETIPLKSVVTTAPAILEVQLQGYSAVAHRVRVKINDTEVGTGTFAGQTHYLTKLPLPAGVLKEGANVVGLEGLGGEIDYSLVDLVSVTYTRQLVADAEKLDFVLRAGQRARVDGFRGSAIRVLDVTNPAAPIFLRATVTRRQDGFSATVGAAPRTRRLLVFAAGAAPLSPVDVLRNRPSSLHAPQGADLVVLSHSDFLGAVAPLVALRQREGLKVAVVDVEDAYDEFAFGAHGPQGIKDFLAWTRSHWQPAPRYVLLVGDATYDPRNERGKNFIDFVPTKLLDTTYLQSPSDDWVVDFNDDGVPELAIGRLPVRTAAEAGTVVGKIVRYGGETSSARNLLLVSDKPIDYNFEAASKTLYGLLPPNWGAQEVNRAQGPTDGAVKARVLAALNDGPSVVNFFGHGSIQIWTSGTILGVNDAANLRNSRLSFYVMMTCLNGYFVDPEYTSLAETLMYNPAGGAFAVWSSTGETALGGQITMDQKALGLLLSKPETTLGDAMVQAKAAVSDIDVRRTWTLIGDPTSRLH